MTSTLDRPALTRPVLKRPAKPAARKAAPERSPLGPGLVAASWALGAGLVTLGIPVLLVWATDSRSGSGALSATQAIGQLWLLAHGASLSIPQGVVGLTPLGLLALPLVLLHRAGRHGSHTLAVHTGRQATRLIVAIAFPYAIAAALVAAVSGTADVRPAPVQAVLGALAVAVLGAGTGVLREAGLLGEARGLPTRLRGLLIGTVVSTAVLVAAGSLLAGASLVRHAERASSLASASDPGVLGGLALLAVGVLSVPNAAVWGAAWLAGPGFAVGVGTAVGPFGTTLGAVPALPLFAALPSAEVPTWLGVMALLVPVLAGVLGGVLVVRHLSLTPSRAAVEGLMLGPFVGLAMAGLAWLSGGPLGGGQLAQVGPSPWRVGVAVALEVGLAAAAASSLSQRLAQNR